MEKRRIKYILKQCSYGADVCPIEDVLNHFGVKTKIRGTQAWFVCPKCQKPKFDYCSATIHGSGSGKFCCQICRTGGGTIKLYSLLGDCSEREALIQLGHLAGSITEEEYMEISGETSSDKTSTPQEKKKVYIEKKPETPERKAPAKVTDYIYRKMLSLPEFGLTEEGKRYLIEKRQLSEQEIEDMGFFTYSKEFSVEKLLEMISQDIYKGSFSKITKEQRQKLTDILWGVPGFYFQFKNGKTIGEWKFVPACPQCIGIPIYNCYGQITALQMRMLEPGERSKYFYISSRRYHQGQETDYGSSPGSPVAVLYPENIGGKTLYITEGIFKARELTAFNNIVFSVQGVNSFGSVAEEALNTPVSSIYKDRGGTGFSRVVLVYDADMFSKWQVLEALIKASSDLSEKTSLPVYVMYWDPELGKGFDDMKQNCVEKKQDYISFLKFLEWEDFKNYVEEAEKDIEEFFKQEHGRKPEVKDRAEKEWAEHLFYFLYELRLKKL